MKQKDKIKRWLKMVDKSDWGNKDGIEPRQENVRTLNSKVYLYSDSSEFWNGVFRDKKKSTMRREKKEKRKKNNNIKL